MANINFRFLADSTQVKKAARDSKNSLGTIEGAAKKVGSALKGAFAIAGIGWGIDALVSGMKQLAEAAVEDNKSMAVLARSMRNTVNASDGQIAQTEKYISQLERQSQILDDSLRPAMSVFVRSVKDVTKAQELLSLATDISVGTGKDLGMVSQALAKAYNGQYASLNKLIPGIAKAKKPIQELREQFAGMAEAASKDDPLAQIELVFNDLYEQLGKKFLPVLKDVADYISGPEGQKMIDGFIEGFGLVVQLAVDAAGAIKDIWDTFAMSPADRAYRDYLEWEEEVQRRREARWAGQKALAQEKQDFYHKEQEVVEEVYGGGKSSIPSIFEEAANTIRDAGQRFRDSVDLGQGLNEAGDKFDLAKVMPGVSKMVAAAKKLPALLNKLKSKGADPSLLSQILNMGPVAGAATAQGLLGSGQLTQFVAARNQLSQFGQQAGLAAGTTGTTAYSININKANMTAEEIIKVIQAYEKKTGRKVTF